MLIIKLALIIRLVAQTQSDESSIDTAIKEADNDGIHSTGSAAIMNRCREFCENSQGDGYSSCMQDCEEKGIINMILFWAVFGGVICLVVIYICCWRREALNCRNCSCHSFRSSPLLEKFLKSIDRQLVTAQNLQAMVTSILHGKWEMEFGKKGIKHDVKNLEIKPKADLKNKWVSLTLNGSDQLGSWNSNGVLVMDKSLVWRLWMIKSYNDSEAYEQLAEEVFQVFFGQYNLEHGVMTGQWFYTDDRQVDLKLGGNWSIIEIAP